MSINRSVVTSNMMPATSNISSLNLNVLKRVDSKVVAPRNPKLLKTSEIPKVRMRPSTYLQEMSLDTEQKLASTHEMRLPRIIELLDMSETTHQKVTYVDIEEAMFQPFPSEIFFQNFKPFTTIEVPLLLRNNDKVPRLVKVTQKDSPYFNIISPDDVSHKVAPGMASVFRICFTPEDNKDYQHELICMTEREKFIVPVRAIGARAILDFPDEINFGVSPVKHANSKVILVRNIGNKVAKFTFGVEEPFSVNIEQNSLAIGDSMQITIDFKPIKVGDYQQDLVVKYDCGDEIHLMLYGGAIDANVRLDKNTIRVDNTFISMANQRVVTIHNRSDVLAHFKFSPFATLQEELLRKEKFCLDLGNDESQEKERFFDECALDPTLRDRLSILTRTFHNRKQVIENDPLLFRDDVFQIKPAEGEIWPNSSVDVTVVFRPTIAQVYHQTAFCDITGRETRLPLKMRGEGMGPRCILSFDSLDIGDVFAGSSHCYEVILANKGDIDAIYGLVESKVHKGEKMFSFNPSEGIVLPNGHQAIKINFSSYKLGNVKRQFVFRVDGSAQPLTFTITGNVIGPTFHFDTKKLKLGNVSFGFNHSKICTLRNTSLVTMNVNFRIPDDGNGEPSISSTYDMNGGSLLKSMANFKRISNPREFDISPAQGAIRAQSEMKVQVTLCSNTVKKYSCLLHVDVQGIGKSILTLPITANTIVPEIKVVTPLVAMGRCFINHPYTATVSLANQSDLPAKYNLLGQKRDGNTEIIYSSSKPRGIIDPRRTVNVPVEVEILVCKDCDTTLSFTTFGNPEYPLQMEIFAKGEGPVIFYTPESLEYGMVEVLTEVTKTVRIENESLIPADFSISMMTKDTTFEVYPCEGTILPRQKIDLQVTAFVNDALLFQEKMVISVDKGQTVSIPLEAKGFGTSIVSDPPLAPSMDLGSHFAESKFVQEFRITNRGRRVQQLNWSTEGHNPVQHLLSLKKASIANPNDMKYKDMIKDMKLPVAPTFQIVPSRVSLKPGESCFMSLEGTSDEPKEVTETISCFSVQGKQNNKERIIKTIVHAYFITPVVNMDREFIHFCIHKGADNQTPLRLQTENFKVQNISSLPLSCTMRTEYPFQVMDHDGVARSVLNVRLDINELIEVTVCFDPLFKYDFYSRCADGAVSITFLEHPHCEILKLRGEVNFPNLSLDKEEIDFGCILNDTEVARYVDITNCSPLPLSYRWSFVVHQGEQNIVYNGAPRVVEAPVEDKPIEHHVRILEEEEKEKKDKEKEDGGDKMDIDDKLDKADSKSSTSSSDDDVFDLEELKKLADNEKRNHIESAGDAAKPTGIGQMTNECEEEKLRCESRMSSRHQPSHPTNMNIDGFPLLPWLEAGDNHIPNGVEEIFDILPLYGTLEPGETQRVTFTYYGHADVSCTAKAVCEVQGGPKYQVGLKGSASLIEYNFDKAEIDFGKQMYDQVAVSTLKLENTGKVGFDFEGLNGLGGSITDGLLPGVPAVDPMCGHVAPFQEVFINVYYCPGVPEKFHKTFELQVAHFEPTVINLRGEGVFHRLSLDLPRIVPTNDAKLMGLLQEAREIVEKETMKNKGDNKQQNGGAKQPGENTKKKSQFEAGASMMEFEQAQDITTELEVQMEFERLMLREFALGSQQSSNISVSGKKSKKSSRLRLSEYLLDFGHIVLGNVKSHIVRATNTSFFSFSFKPERSALFQSGFCMDLDRVKQLPGFPEHETVDFKITFDPRGGNLPIGPVSANVPINIANGPQINIRLRGIVAVPDLKLNTEMVDFGTVQCGQCKIVTVQLYNSERVPCEWLSTLAAAEIKKKKQNPWAHHNSKKYKRKKTKHFEMMPDRGVLFPDARVNLQIKFMPTEEKIYTQKLVIHIAQATSRMQISVRGRGLEPQLDFDPSMVTFGPILPHGSGVENSVIVRNPCPFPIEFYSLNFDDQYLMEEKILRYMHGYDEYMNLLLPPRTAGDELPPELIEFNRTMEEERKVAADGTITDFGSSHAPFIESEETRLESPSNPAPEADMTDVDKDEIVVQTEAAENAEHEDDEHVDEVVESCQQSNQKSQNKEGVGELEITPVSKAIARHLGIDLSAEGRAARNRRGIVIVLHGPPRSGKTNAAVALAKKYGAARLTIDSIVLDAISDGNTKAGLKARELCQIAARGMKSEEEDSNLHVGLSYEAVNAHSNPGTDEKSGGNKLVAQSVISTKRASVLSKQTHSNIPSHKTHLQGSPEANSQSGIHDGSPAGAPIPRRLSVSASVAGEEGLVSAVLPEDLLIEIMADRFQLNDCHQGFVVDGVDTLFSSGHQATVRALLKAINNRKFIFFVALRLSFENFHKREKKLEKKKQAASTQDGEFQKIDFDDLDEDEYDALPDHIKKRLENDKLVAKRKRIKKETEEKMEKQKLLNLERAESEKRQMEDSKKKGKKPKREESGPKKISPGKSVDSDSKSRGQTARESRIGMNPHKLSLDAIERDSVADPAENSPADEANAGKKPNSSAVKKGKKAHKQDSGESASEDKSMWEELDLNDEQKALLKKFTAFDHSIKELSHLLDNWDRATLDMRKPSTPDEFNMLVEDDPKPQKRASKKEREKEKLERERLERERHEKEKADREKQEKLRAENNESTVENPSGVVEEDPVTGVPMYIFESDEVVRDPLENLKHLPTTEEVLDGLGLGVNGPPIPPPVSFSVVPFPVKRKPPSANESGGRFEFITSPPILETSNAETEIEESVEVSSRLEKMAAAADSQGSKKGKKDKGGRKNSPSASRKHRRNSQEDVKSPPVDPALEEQKELSKTPRYRWVVPAGGEIPLKVHFKSDGLGMFDQTLDFELTSTRRKYQVFCRGVSGFPTISREPRVVFPRRRKSKLKQDEIVFKRFLVHENYFEFGPLLCGKTRERYKEKRYMENVETITIKNVSPLQSVVSFCFQHDINATTFILDPPNMVLEPDEVQSLNVWAYPKTAGRFTDSIVCCVRENPEPITYDVACHGVRPEIELDRKLIQFDKILLHRKDTRALVLRNITLLPVAWRVAGMENLGEDFTLNQESGVIATNGEFALQLNFRATKPVTVKKIIRVEVYDVDNIMGLVQAENIQVTAEAYDVALDMSFPKGADGGLDFGTIRVLDESKQICSLKNKGKYEIGFNFVFEKPPRKGMRVEEIFSVLPQKGTLVGNDRPTQVQVVFTTESETTIKELPLLKCQVIEPNLGEGNEVIASIPIKLSGKSLFSKYEVYPASDINFGPMLLNSRKSRNFTIVNKGEFDFKYSICKMYREVFKQNSKGGKPREDSNSSRSQLPTKGKASAPRTETLGGQARLQLGNFTISPGIGNILPGTSQVVTVDCVAETIGKSEEYLGIDISDRDPTKDVNGVMYKIMNEGCLPGINTTDLLSVFEEHRILPNMSVTPIVTEIFGTSGVYFEEENKFSFTNIIVGRKATARFKISNVNKVPVDITTVLKPMVVKGKVPENFEVEPTKAQILAHDHVYVSVTFTPTSMEKYSCFFETAVDGLPPSISKGRSITFEMFGEGSIPRVIVVQPKIRNKKRNPLLAFKRTLLGKSDHMQLALKNEGIFDCQVNLILEEEEGILVDPDPKASREMTTFKENKIFALTPSTGCKPAHPNLQPHASGDPPYTSSVRVEANTTCYFDVKFFPIEIGVCNGRIRILTVDNQFEENSIQLYGEGFQGDVTVENLHPENEIATFASKSSVVDMDVMRRELTSSSEAGGSGCRGELLDFGDCYVNRSTVRTFTLVNNSKTDIYRFAWDKSEKISFKPTVGHLHPGCSKEMAVTCFIEKPEAIVRNMMKCELQKIAFINPNEVMDWDDRLQTIRWVDAGKEEKKTQSGGPAKKKVMETEAEPAYSVVEHPTSIELFVSARANFATFTCETNAINFRDTLIMQPRVYEFTMVNTSDVVLDYTWQIVAESGKSSSPAPGDLSRTPSPATPRSQSARSYPVGASMQSPVLGDDVEKPFSMSPMSGGIPAGETETFTVRFAPVDVNEFQSWLLCDVHNANPTTVQEPSIVLRGKSIMPHCHFEFEDSDYLSRHNTDDDTTSLESKVRCFELSSVGLRKAQKKFWITNPTPDDYHFKWVCDDNASGEDFRPPFVCDTTCGKLVSGKKLLTVFTYSPQALGTVESKWTFEIVDKQISIPFLLVGHCREPQISLNLSHLNFKPTLVGHQTHETVYLINRESVEFQYTVKPSSCHASASSTRLDISPMRGEIEANSQCPITMTHNPKVSGNASFSLEVVIANKFKPVVMNVKAASYEMDVKLLCENSQEMKIELSSFGLNAINLGDVQLMENCIRKLHIRNVGNYSCRYCWKLVQGDKVVPQITTELPPLNSDEDAAASNPVLSVVPGQGFVPAGETREVMMTYQPRKVGKLADSQLVMEISEGPTFSCQINGRGISPGLEMSFTKHSFGPCFVYKAGMPINQVILEMVNRGKCELSVECLYTNNDFLEMKTKPLILLPNEGTNIPIKFYPRDCIRYCEKIPFRINGVSTRIVEIRGEGTEMKVEVQNSKQKVVKFGASRIGKTIRHIVPIINRSPRPISINLSVTPLSSELMEEGVIRLLPPGKIQLEGNGGKRDVEIYFHPKTRIAPFTEEVMMECAGLSQPLFIITGCCQGIDIRLDQDHIPFGAIVVNSRTKRRFTMKNIGDIGASFKWDAPRFKPDFTITPIKGYISPGMEIPFEVEFHPTVLSQDIRYEGVKCHIENHSESLSLTLTGMCISAPSLKETLNFSCVVRSKDNRNILMNNRSSTHWVLRPVVEGDFFTGADTFIVEPGQNRTYDIEYYPLEMTNETKHQGSVFFPLPDGTGLLYSLFGTADAPKSAGTINRDVPCKTAYVELLNVENWLNKPQRFKVTVEMVKPDKLDPSTTLKGMDYIDVPAGASRDYKLKFFAHKEGTFGAKVVFKNEKTGEYLYYYVTLRATSPGVISTIELHTAVRKGVSHTINIENPLPGGVTFYSECKVADINLPPQIVIPAHSKGSYTLEYLPLKVGENAGKLTLLSQELGHYQYDLTLKAHSCGQERVSNFSAQLGQSDVITIKFVNYARQKTEYSPKFSSPDFSAERGVTAAPASSSGGTEVTIDVTYEPSQLGRSTGMMTLSSAIGGEYSFPLLGDCVEPKPQGPFTVKKGANVFIPFKNVFASTIQFQYKVDNNFFQVKPHETIRSKKVQNIQVSFDGKIPARSVQTCMLTVLAAKSNQPNLPTTTWVFYLKGYGPESN